MTMIRKHLIPVTQSSILVLVVSVGMAAVAIDANPKVILLWHSMVKLV